MKLFDKEWWFRKKITLLRHFVHPEIIEHKLLVHRIELCYLAEFGEKLHLRHPRTLNEKLIWLALYWQHPLKAACADKVKLRDYVSRKGLPVNLMPKILGCWNFAEEIDFESLPSQYVLKCNHGCAMNIIVKDARFLDRAKTVQKINGWLKETYVGSGCEFHYADISPHLVFCEEFIPIVGNGLYQIDYKVMCINGDPQFILLCYDRDEDENANLASFSTDWEQLFLCNEEKSIDIKKPVSLTKMLEYSRILSKDFPFVRVDFYESNGCPILGELTFTPYGNMITYIKTDALCSLGKKLKLPKRYRPQ